MTIVELMLLPLGKKNIFFLERLKSAVFLYSCLTSSTRMFFR